MPTPCPASQRHVASSSHPLEKLAAVTVMATAAVQSFYELVYAGSQDRRSPRGVAFPLHIALYAKSQ